jgi:c-di-GMP-binding flagellar brake protein YcgR
MGLPDLGNRPCRGHAKGGGLMDSIYSFHTRIIKSPEEDRAIIVAGFQDIIKRGVRTSLRLLNYYKGLPISYPATIAEINNGILELDVHQQQTVAIERAKLVFIKCDYFDSAIMAEVQSADIRRMIASLKNFQFVDIMAERRDALRLQLDPPTEAEINHDASRFTGQLFDISLGGFSIRTTDPSPLGKEEDVTLRVMVPNLLQNSLTSLETQACHIATTDEGNNYFICRFSFQADAQSEATISRFIFQRQVEIIREIKEAL